MRAIFGSIQLTGTFHCRVYRVKLISPHPARDNFVVPVIEIVQLFPQLNHLQFARPTRHSRAAPSRRIDLSRRAD